MKTYLTLAFLFFAQLVFCQYQPFESKGDIPNDFTTYSYQKYKQELEQVDRKSKRRTRINQKYFFLESNFGIDDLLQSGYVMFNDPVSEYVTEIANVLLENEPELKNKLRFYTVRSSSVNAFATNQGIILVNMGLIAQLKSEAQLAFILAHEIAHFKEQHALKFYLESREIDRRQDRNLFKRKNFENTLTKNQFSKEQESEADELGLALFLKSKYNLEGVKGAFDVLQYAYLPFAEIPFNKSYFEDDYLIFKDDYQLDSIQSISIEVDEDDEKSTHPSLPKRRIAAATVIKKNSNDNRVNYLISASRFKDLQKRARYELLEYQLRDYAFYESFYNAYSLQKEFPEDLHLKKVIAKSLYGFTKMRNARQFSDYQLKYKKIEGELGSVVYFINGLEKFEMNALALRYAYLLKDEFKDDLVFQDMIEDLSQDMVNKHSKKLKKFQPGKATDIPDVPLPKKPSDDASEEEKAKYKEMLTKQKEEGVDKYVYYGFGDFLEQGDFNAMVKKCKDTKSEKREQEGSRDNKFISRNFSDVSNKGNFALGENKVLVINPFYLKLNRGFKKQLLIKTEKAQMQFNKSIQKNAGRLDLKLAVLDPNNFAKKDVEAFNDYKEIQEWFGHQMNMEDEFRMIAFNQERINKLTKKYQVDTFVWAGVMTGKKGKSGFDVVGKFIFNQFAWLYTMITPKGETIIFSMALDVETGRTRMGSFDYLPYVDHKDVIKQRVYDILSQVKKKPSK
jgi:Zn-dependent protease with chaperone function